MAEITRRRVGELQRAIFTVLAEAPSGQLSVQEVAARAESICPATPFEDLDYPKRPGRRRYPTLLRFVTIGPVKAGWMIKDAGTWHITDEGKRALADFVDPEAFARAAEAGYKSWQAQAGAAPYRGGEAAEDAEAALLENSETRPRRAWLVRGANVEGVNVLPSWFAEGYCSLSFGEVGEIATGLPLRKINKIVATAYPDQHAVTHGLYGNMLNRFVNEMKIGDVIVTVDGSKVYTGVVSGEPSYVPDGQGTERRRPVSWTNAEKPFLRADLSTDAADGLRGQLTLSDLTPSLAEFARLGGIELRASEEIVATVTEVTAQIGAPGLALAQTLRIPLDWLVETVDLLNDKRQIVFYGPPGTGKTYLAQELCKALVEDAGGEYAIVQFHPSYAYEDFFEGIRPRLGQAATGGISFELVSGPLRRMADLARSNPTRPYVLIIDEINRANLAKVFGELYFLLEYRGQRVNVQYSSEEFWLPRNLFLIGTMNTADRSIALVDAAMRRRFYFRGLFPGEPPIADVLRTWLRDQGFSTEAAELLDELNAAIDDPEFAIGPSYLMTPRVARPRGLEQIWDTGILPLLTEHYFGEGRAINKDFGLAALRARIQTAVAAERPELEGSDVVGRSEEP